jgi:hypothetical protein
VISTFGSAAVPAQGHTSSVAGTRGLSNAIPSPEPSPMFDTWGMDQRPLDELEAGLAEIRRSPADAGELRLIVRRPATDRRELVETAELDVERGLVGDSWFARGSKATDDGSADAEAQVTLMNARLAALIAGPPDAWAIAGDQLYVDFDIGVENLPAGSRLTIGEATLEVSATPHTGCIKFSGRFGLDALKFVSTPVGRALRLRGVNTRIVRGGTIRLGDKVGKIAP